MVAEEDQIDGIHISVFFYYEEEGVRFKTGISSNWKSFKIWSTSRNVSFHCLSIVDMNQIQNIGETPASRVFYATLRSIPTCRMVVGDGRLLGDLLADLFLSRGDVVLVSKFRRGLSAEFDDIYHL